VRRVLCNRSSHACRRRWCRSRGAHSGRVACPGWGVGQAGGARVCRGGARPLARACRRGAEPRAARAVHAQRRGAGARRARHQAGGRDGAAERVRAARRGPARVARGVGVIRDKHCAVGRGEAPPVAVPLAGRAGAGLHRRGVVARQPGRDRRPRARARPSLELLQRAGAAVRPRRPAPAPRRAPRGAVPGRRLGVDGRGVGPCAPVHRRAGARRRRRVAGRRRGGVGNEPGARPVAWRAPPGADPGASGLLGPRAACTPEAERAVRARPGRRRVPLRARLHRQVGRHRRARRAVPPRRRRRGPMRALAWRR